MSKSRGQLSSVFSKDQVAERKPLNNENMVSDKENEDVGPSENHPKVRHREAAKAVWELALCIPPDIPLVHWYSCTLLPPGIHQPCARINRTT